MKLRTRCEVLFAAITIIKIYIFKSVSFSNPLSNSCSNETKSRKINEEARPCKSTMQKILKKEKILSNHSPNKLSHSCISSPSLVWTLDPVVQKLPLWKETLNSPDDRATERPSPSQKNLPKAKLLPVEDKLSRISSPQPRDIDQRPSFTPRTSLKLPERGD